MQLLNNLHKVGRNGKNADIIHFILISLKEMLKNDNKEISKKSRKLIKTVNIERKNLHIFWTTWGITIKFSGKMWLIILNGLLLFNNKALPSL